MTDDAARILMAMLDPDPGPDGYVRTLVREHRARRRADLLAWLRDQRESAVAIVGHYQRQAVIPLSGGLDADVFDRAMDAQERAMDWQERVAAFDREIARRSRPPLWHRLWRFRR